MSIEVTKLLGRQNLTNVPKDQQKLLDKHDIGARRPHGGPDVEDVPGHVFSTVRDAFIESRKRKASLAKFTGGDRPTKSTKTKPHQNGTKPRDTHTEPDRRSPRRKSLSQQPSSPPQDDNAHKSRNPRPNQGRVQPDQDRPRPSTSEKQPSNSLPSSPEIPIPWTPSPQREDNGPKPQSTAPSLVASHISGTHKSMGPPPRPEASQQPAPNFDFPSSDPEDDLEVELPQAQNQSQEPSNRQSEPQSYAATYRAREHLAMNTPPCAQPSQPVIPATVDNDSSLALQPDKGDQSRTKRMKPIQFSSDPATATAAVQLPNVTNSFRRMASTKTYSQMSSSNPMPSSSIVPATLPQDEIQVEDRSSASSNSLSRTRSIDERTDAMIETQAPPVHDNRILLDHEEHYTQILPSVENGTSIYEIREPFEAFTSHYPTYTTKYAGTLWHFVRACVCLDFLRRQRGLREVLWDDFIRAFAAYQEYAERTAHPLVAVEWFNDIVGDSVFKSRIVNQKNLNFILNTYSGHVAKARRTIRDDNDGDTTYQGTEIPATPGFVPATNASLAIERASQSMMAHPNDSETHPRTDHPRDTGVSKAHTPLSDSRLKSDIPSRLKSRDRILQRRSLGSLATKSGSSVHPLKTQTPKAPTNTDDVPSTTQTSTPRGTPGSSSYFSRLHRTRTAEEQKRYREFIKRRSSAGSSFSRSVAGSE